MIIFLAISPSPSLITAESQSNSILICETNVKVKTEEHFCKG